MYIEESYDTTFNINNNNFMENTSVKSPIKERVMCENHLGKKILLNSFFISSVKKPLGKKLMRAGGAYCVVRVFY